MRYNKLEPYEELVGFLEQIQHGDGNISITVSRHVLIYATQSPEADYINAHVTLRDIGRRIAFMATDIPDKPLLVRWPDDTRAKEPNPIWGTLFERAVNGGSF